MKIVTREQRAEDRGQRADLGCRSALTGRFGPGARHGRNSLTSDFCPLTSGFTLLEVIVACAVFFMVVFAVLELVTQGLSSARALERREPDAGLLAAALSLTNQLADGDSASGSFEDLAPGLYPGYTWDWYATEASSNGLYQVDFTVYHKAGKKGASESHLSILMFRAGSGQGNNFRRLGGAR